MICVFTQSVYSGSSTYATLGVTLNFTVFWFVNKLASKQRLFYEIRCCDHAFVVFDAVEEAICIEPSILVICSRIFLTPKNTGSSGLCVDHRDSSCR